MAYFLKEQIKHEMARPIYLPTGNKLVFENVDGDLGILETGIESVAAELRKLNGRGGVFEITGERYGELKKKVGSPNSAAVLNRSTDRSLQGFLAQKGAASVAGSKASVAAKSNPQARTADPTAPLTVTPEIVKPARPRVGRASDILAERAPA